MSTVYKGVNYAETQTSPPTQIEEGQYNAIAKHILDQFVMTADLASGDTVLVGGPIPAGAVLLNAVLTAQALGGSAALNFGYQAGVSGPTGSIAAEAAVATAFFSALPVSTATVALAHGSTYEGAFYTQVPLTSQVQPVITCSVASSGATGKSIMVDISYTKSGG